ncbi:hypothetical protein Mal15_38030 [Stieleria maiorica]|uniref:Uncharacterized protein n=2 Tax=Stieleria maiorica TaxID=2795974 RepID=A0A5B9MLD0_9BACT|nr:hypothetical protein Mal15_38030 [Stieleria maiorica]
MQVRQKFPRHGGTYRDPHTDLPRQFDLQSEHVVSNDFHWSRFLHAVECKNLTECGPILISRSKCTRQESGHWFLHTKFPKSPQWTRGPERQYCLASDEHLFTAKFGGLYSRYREGEMVGKSIDHIVNSGSRIKGGDKDIYSRWSQAVASATSLIDVAREVLPLNKQAFMRTAIVPVLVVPNDRLFVVDYDEEGRKTGPVRAVSWTPFYIDYHPPNLPKSIENFRFSFLEIITVDGLAEVMHALNTGAFPGFDVLLDSEVCDDEMRLQCENW